jgi:hypothetical protein
MVICITVAMKEVAIFSLNVMFSPFILLMIETVD